MMLRHRRFASLLLLAAAPLVAAACVSTNLPPIGTTASFAPESDERELWESARQAEARVLPANLVYSHIQTQSYVQGLADRLTPAAYRSAGGQPILVRVRIDPRLNAMAMPHGVLILHTGTIARAESEGQLAGVLAHEITHVTHRHLVREARAIKNRETATAVVGFVAVLGLAALAVDQSQRGHPETAEAILRAGTPLLMVGLQLTRAAMVNGYSREIEQEADEEGMRLMASAGYQPRELGGFFRHILNDKPDAGSIETFFYGNHPRTVDRLANVERVAGTLVVSGQGGIGQDEFDRRLVAVRLANAQYDATFGRIVLARRQVEKALASLPETIRPGATMLMDGHIRAAAAYAAARNKNQALERRLLEQAEGAYLRTISWARATPAGSPLAPQAYKALGLFYLQRSGFAHRQCEARNALEKYLELQPGAPDRSEITTKLRELRC